MKQIIPRILIIDDLFGREVYGNNRERENLCGKFLLAEEVQKGKAKSCRFVIPNPVARVVFCRGQIPNVAEIGTIVENDLNSSLATVHEGWVDAIDKGELPWAMVLLDLCFYTGRVTEESHRRTPGMPEGRPVDDDPRSYFGLSLLDAIHGEFPELPVVILSSMPREDVSREFTERGALGFIDRSDQRGPELLQELLWQNGLLPDLTETVIGNSLPVLLALREARRASRHRQNLLIRGERGSGKELLANYIHRVSTPADENDKIPFVMVNSAVLTPNLFASELFGIEPKTATAVDGKIGLIEAADHGDLFLDEIADMPPEVQAAVLRVLQERQITPVGGRKSKTVDVRFLSASNSDLEDEVLKFRPDLLDRLRLGGTLWLPPLRDRKTDIPLLVEKFVREAEAVQQNTMRREITHESLDLLHAHDWPGNIRELRTCLFDAVNRHPDVEHLVPGHLRIAPEGHNKQVVRKPEPQLSPVQEQNTGSTTNLAAMIEMQAGMQFDHRDIAKWSGRFADLQHTHAWLLARLLLAAIEATKRRTPEHPEGLIQIHPAVKLVTGDPSLTASKAADIIKRLLSPLNNELAGDLSTALSIAIRLRPRSARAVNSNF